LQPCASRYCLIEIRLGAQSLACISSPDRTAPLHFHIRKGREFFQGSNGGYRHGKHLFPLCKLAFAAVLPKNKTATRINLHKAVAILFVHLSPLNKQIKTTSVSFHAASYQPVAKTRTFRHPMPKTKNCAAALTPAPVRQM